MSRLVVSMVDQVRGVPTRPMQATRVIGFGVHLGQIDEEPFVQALLLLFGEFRLRGGGSRLLRVVVAASLGLRGYVIDAGGSFERRRNSLFNSRVGLLFHWLCDGLVLRALLLLRLVHFGGK